MTTIIKNSCFLLAAVLLFFSSCKKEKYSFGELKAPSDLTLATTIAGADDSNPNGNGSGVVDIVSTAKNALTYNIDFGDGNKQVVATGAVSHKYTAPGTASYTITVNVVGTGGIISTISKRITVFVAFEIPDDIMSALTNGSSRTWICANDVGGHFGVGPSSEFAPIWYAADPNSRQPCAYDDEITFTKDGSNTISMTLDNKGQSFIIGAAAGYYGLASAEDCKDLAGGGTKRLAFMEATSASTTANSTRIQFTVPGNGLLIFGTGANTYEILSITPTAMFLRNIGIDGNAWYQKLKVKP